MQYNALFEVAALPVLITLLGYLVIRYRNRKSQDRMFIRLVIFVTLADALDVAIALIQHGDPGMNGAVIILHTLDHICGSCSSFAFVGYIYEYIEERTKLRRAGAIVDQIVLVIIMLLYLENLLTGNVFGYDNTGKYYEGELFILAAYVLPFWFMIHGVIATIVHRMEFRKSQLYAMLVGFLYILVAYSLQLFLFKDTLITFYAAALAAFIIFLSHESPEYYDLESTMDELRRSRDEAEKAKLDAIAADEAKAQFLSQMSHEIRTPINAIMGYNNIIMEDTDEEATREYSRKARLAARRLLDFFEGLFNYDLGGSEEKLREITEGTDDDGSPAGSENEAPPAPLTGAEDFRILVVDDTEMNVDLLVRILRSMGFETDTAPDGEKALDRIRTNKYDLIFMDHMMPIMDGMEAMEVIKREKLCEQTPVIMLTANLIKGEKEKYLNAGFAEYVPKPFSEASIKEAILRHLPLNEEDLSRSSWQEEWRLLQKELPFLRLAKAKEHFLSDADFFVDILRDFATSPVAGRLEEYIEQGDYYNYRAVLCSVKDSSRLIGADRIAERAAKLEDLYVKGEIGELKVKQVAFIEELKKLFKQLSAAMYLTDDKSLLAAVSAQTDARPLVLVIDDDPVVCGMIEEILSRLYRVISVGTGEEGIILAQEEAPALILLDVNLMSMNGFDVIRALTSIEETAEIPVVFMTADDNGEAEIKGFQCGGADFVRKPFVPEVLIRRVRRIIELTALQKHLRREISRQTEKVGLMSREVMLALSKAVDAKDKYTNDHSQRVAKYASWIGKQLGKSKREQDDLYIMGLMHDVGKIGVHEEIINKPGRLTDEEYEEIKSHTTVGYEILKVITEMPEAAKCARWHHERYDGRGYPDGISGTDIPENARIICVADSYDAMTSRRAYQALKPQADVRAEMIRCKGTQFDPLIADAMVRIIDEDVDYELHG